MKKFGAKKTSELWINAVDLSNTALIIFSLEWTVYFFANESGPKDGIYKNGRCNEFFQWRAQLNAQRKSQEHGVNILRIEAQQNLAERRWLLQCAANRYR